MVTLTLFGVLLAIALIGLAITFVAGLFFRLHWSFTALLVYAAFAGLVGFVHFFVHFPLVQLGWSFPGSMIWAIIAAVFFLAAAALAAGVGTARRVVSAVLLSLAALLYGIAAPVSINISAYGHHHTTQPPSGGGSYTTSPSPTASPSSCPGGHNVVEDPNKGGKIISTGIDTSNPVKGLSQIEDVAAHDPRVLTLYWNASPLAKTNGAITNPSSLSDGHGCYTQDAANKFEELKGAYESASATPSTAPANGNNTGAVSGGTVYQISGVSGAASSRSAIEFKFPDGTIVYAMKRCGNLVTPPGTTIPKVPTKPGPSPKPKPSPSHSPSPSPSPSPSSSKCATLHHNSNGTTTCGTPLSGPEQQNPKAEPSTTGYPGNGETVIAKETASPSDPYSPDPTYGTQGSPPPGKDTGTGRTGTGAGIGPSPAGPSAPGGTTPVTAAPVVTPSPTGSASPSPVSCWDHPELCG